jgi:hypothetical protein
MEGIKVKIGTKAESIVSKSIAIGIFLISASWLGLHWILAIIVTAIIVGVASYLFLTWLNRDLPPNWLHKLLETEISRDKGFMLPVDRALQKGGTIIVLPESHTDLGKK